jgi:hypothetical protein
MSDTELNPILDEDDIIPKTTCFNEHYKANVSCEKTSCKYWIPNEANLNCTMIASKRGPMTLQVIGDIFGVTRMRVCQIEKSVIQKLAGKTEEISDL